MLHTETVDPGTLSILNRLMALPALQPFALVGGTALSLRYGHRTSVDLDLFFHEKFNHDAVVDALQQEFQQRFSYTKQHAQFGIFCFIENVKTDIVHYPHLPISSVQVEEEIRMYSDADIAAMKIQAILGRGQKKDFWDLYELLKHYPLQQIMDWHKQKYSHQRLAINITQAITYFADADEGEAPISLKGQSWKQIKESISQTVLDYLK